MPVRSLTVLAAFSLSAFVATAQETRLTEPAIRSFVAQQDEARAKADFEAFSLTFQSDAAIVGVFYDTNGTPHVHTDTPESNAKAMAGLSARRTNRTSKTDIRNIRVAPDGQGATVTLVYTADFDVDGKHRHRVFDDTMLVVLDGGTIKGTADVSIERAPGQ